MCPKVSSALSGEARPACAIVTETWCGKLALFSRVLFLAKQDSTNHHHEMHLKCKGNVKRSDLRNVGSHCLHLSRSPEGAVTPGFARQLPV